MDEFMDYMGYLYANGKTLDDNGNEVDKDSDDEDEE
jgi:hypothetical protein